jgi:nucleoside-diphosphate-sugar epimerase
VAAERLLRRFGAAGGCQVSILRAPGIYAADRLPLERLRRDLPVFLADEDSYSNHIHAQDLARACVVALARGAANRTYNVSDDSALKIGDWYDKLADAFALPRPQRLPRAAARAVLSPVMLSFMNESRRLDNGRLKRELKLRLRYPTVDAGIATAKENRCSG